MSYKKDEKELMEKLEDEWIERLVTHLRFKLYNDKPKKVKLDGKKYDKTRAVTFVALLKENCNLNGEKIKKDFYSIENDDDIEEFTKKYEDSDDLVACGYAICDERDNFNKTLGRLIATGRAYKKYNKTK